MRSSDLNCSFLGGGSGGGFGSWVGVGWVSEFSVVVFVVEGSDGLFSHGDEIVYENLVGNVSVKVILEVLKHIHVLLDHLISSYSWE
jgi:hypothetical protein